MKFNWKIESQYQYASAMEAGWECLRRNQEFQHDYRILMQLYQLDHDHISKSLKFQNSYSLQKVRQIIFDTIAIANKEFEKFKEKYSLPWLSIPNPELKLAEQNLDIHASIVEAVDHEFGIGLYPHNDSTVVCKFDVRLPKEQQMEYLSRIFDEKKEQLINDRTLKSARRRIDKAANAMRVFDATAAHASESEILCAIFPGKNNSYPDQLGSRAIKNHLKIAKRLISQDFRNLINS